MRERETLAAHDN